MRQELEKRLVTEFPTFFRDMWGDPRKTCMAWGCSHGDGWYPILYELCQGLLAESLKDPSTDFHFLQIKEKFGRLTLYHSGGNKEMCCLIDEAEKKSESICEECGVGGVSIDYTLPWYRALCEGCKIRTNQP